MRHYMGRCIDASQSRSVRRHMVPAIDGYRTWYDQENDCYCAAPERDIPDDAMMAGCRFLIRAGFQASLWPATANNDLAFATWTAGEVTL